MSIKHLTVLGATGSIGSSTLAIVRNQPERFNVFALSGHQRIAELARLCHEFQPAYAVVMSQEAAQQLRALLVNCPTQILIGQAGLIEVATAPEVDVVMAAIVGAAGLAPTYAAIQASKQVLLANKEALVMAGELMMTAVKTHQATLLPVDSEHNALFQCLPEDFLAPRLFPQRTHSTAPSRGVEKIILTASGGAFRDLPLQAFASITPEAACQHPNWQMGKKITVDSATMMNKALEVIEAYYLFGLPLEKIDVVIHPQSVVHSLVAYQDGSLLAQLGEADMRIPIANVLAWPERVPSGAKNLDLCQHHLTFKAMDLERYPAFALGYQALKLGGSAPCILNAANEIAVEAFLQRHIPFTAIARLVEHALHHIPAVSVGDFDTLLAVDQQTRAYVTELTHSFSEKFL